MAPRGTEQHADTVMSQAKEYFSSLGSNNIFQPKVLVKVSRNSVFLVGCSMAVSSFLRPLCLYNRIATFKCRLREAVVLNRPLDPGDQKEQWSSSAFMRGRQDDRAPGNQEKRGPGYTEPKNPCGNCQVMFQNLKGFIPANAEAENRDTFQGACAEYIPVSELIKDDTQDRPTVAVQNKLEVHLKKCIYLCENYRKIADELCQCYNADTRTLKKVKKLLNAAYHEVPHIHIFGFKPELKM